MEEYEKNSINDCINEIEDSLDAIKKEIGLPKPYRYYILEKINHILFDANYIKNICESEDK